MLTLMGVCDRSTSPALLPCKASSITLFFSA